MTYDIVSIYLPYPATIQMHKTSHGHRLPSLRGMDGECLDVAKGAMVHKYSRWECRRFHGKLWKKHMSFLRGKRHEHHTNINQG